VALTVQRDEGDLKIGLERWLGRPLRSLVRPGPGFSCETLVVDGELVVRLPPLADGIFPAYDLAQQAAVQDAVGASGVPVAGPCRVESDSTFLGAPFITMAFVRGPIPSDFTPSDPWLAGLASDGDRRAVWDSLLDTMVAIHRTPTDGLGLRQGLEVELDAWDDYVRWSTMGDTPPAGLLEVMAWCHAERPTSEPNAGLLWGDVRFGNVVFDEQALSPRAVLDWDMASAGPFEEDLAWFLTLEELQFELTSMTVPGFGTRAEAIGRAEAGLGRTLEDLGWYEVFALIRAAAIATRIAVLHEKAGRRSTFRVGHDPSLAAALKRIR
jgi:aminoglycoside phosphotransferase (APT) family kinase protein